MIRLKIWPEPFDAVMTGKKRYEVRTADRDFKVGDLFILNEYLPEQDEYTGRKFMGRITYITKAGTWGLPENLCVFGFEEI